MRSRSIYGCAIDKLMEMTSCKPGARVPPTGRHFLSCAKVCGSPDTRAFFELVLDHYRRSCLTGDSSLCPLFSLERVCLTNLLKP